MEYFISVFKIYANESCLVHTRGDIHNNRMWLWGFLLKVETLLVVDFFFGSLDICPLWANKDATRNAFVTQRILFNSV